MAADDVIECSACFGEVHPDATRCRHCGASFETPWYRTKWASIAAGLVVGGLILSAFSAAQSNASDDAEDEVDQISCEAGDTGACLDLLDD